MTARQEVIQHIANRIEALDLGHPTRVGIDGVDAAGKTTLADELAEWLTAPEEPSFGLQSMDSTIRAPSVASVAHTRPRGITLTRSTTQSFGMYF